MTPGEQRRPTPAATGTGPNRHDTDKQQVEAEGTHERARQRARHERRQRVAAERPTPGALDRGYVSRGLARAQDGQVRRLRRQLGLAPPPVRREQVQTAALQARAHLLALGLYGEASDRLLRAAWDAA